MRPTEIRTTRGAVELRAGGDAPKIGGYALKFNRESDNLGGFVERIAPGFLSKSAGDGWPGVMARWNHDDAYLLGTVAAGTLRLAVDDIGLDYEVDPPATRADVVELVQRGDVFQSSFAFRTIDDEWSLTEQGFPLRTLIAGQLVDVAPVNTPAYRDTSTGLRSLAEAKEADLEEVRAMAASGDLARLFRRSDSAQAAPTDVPEVGAAKSTPPSAVERLRLLLDIKKN